MPTTHLYKQTVRRTICRKYGYHFSFGTDGGQVRRRPNCDRSLPYGSTRSTANSRASNRTSSCLRLTIILGRCTPSSPTSCDLHRWRRLLARQPRTRSLTSLPRLDRRRSPVHSTVTLRARYHCKHAPNEHDGRFQSRIRRRARPRSISRSRSVRRDPNAGLGRKFRTLRLRGVKSIWGKKMGATIGKVEPCPHREDRRRGQCRRAGEGDPRRDRIRRRTIVSIQF